MKHPSPVAAAAIALAVLATALPVAAHDGDDHGGEASPTGHGAAWPRFAASSELFELVGVLDGKRLTLYLDHAADNTPVEGATLELDIGGVVVPAQPHGSGEFEATLAQAPGDGVTAVTVTVWAGGEADLLAGELDIHRDTQAAEAGSGVTWQRWLPWALAGVFALIAAALGLRRARARTGAQP